MEELSIEIIFLIIKKLSDDYLIKFSWLSKKYRNLVSNHFGSININERYFFLFLFNNYYLNKKLFSLKIENLNLINLFKDFYSLNLFNAKVTDVSMLGNVRTLNLSRTQVTDVSMLGNVNKKITNIVIPDSVTSIEDETFSSCKKLTKVNIGNSITSIGNDAFYNHKSMIFNTSY